MLRIGSRWELVATDGRRLVLRTIPSLFDFEPGSYLICGEVVRAMAGMGKTARNIELKLTPYDSSITWNQRGKRGFEDREAHGTSGRFPKVSDVMDGASKPPLSTIETTVRDLLCQVPEASSVYDLKTDKKGKVRFERVFQVDNVKLTGDPLAISFCVEYLADWLRELEPKEDIKLEFRGKDKPIFGRSDNFTYVLMPCAIAK